MNLRNQTMTEAVIATHGLAAPPSHHQADIGKHKSFGTVYAKLLDGNRRRQRALYNNAELTPGQAGGDQGQGIEF